MLDLPRFAAGREHRSGARQRETVWLVAHVDSKWQPVSMIVRVLGVITSSMACSRSRWYRSLHIGSDSLALGALS